jgi:hypothetical protein
MIAVDTVEGKVILKVAFGYRLEMDRTVNFIDERW